MHSADHCQKRQDSKIYDSQYVSVECQYVSVLVVSKPSLQEWLISGQAWFHWFVGVSLEATGQKHSHHIRETKLTVQRTATQLLM